MSEQPEREALWVDGIGPPLSQLREDYAGMESAEAFGSMASDVLALIAAVEQLTKELTCLEDALLRCGQLALNRKTGAIQVLVKRTLGVEHFGPRSGQ
jgi:hypothetical protein